MSIHLFDGPIAGTPTEPMLLEEVTVRLIDVAFLAVSVKLFHLDSGGTGTA